MTDGTIVINSNGGVDEDSVAGTQVADVMMGVYAPATSSPVTVKIQILAAGGGTASIAALTNGNSIEWTVIRIN